jgi:methyl-accepting chemotaxis protein
MSIHSKLASGFALIIIFLLAQGVITFYYVSNSNKLVDQAIESSFQQSQYIAQLSIDGQKLRRYEKEYFIYVNNDRKREKYFGEWTEAKNSIHSRLTAAINDNSGTWSLYDRNEMEIWKGSLLKYSDGFNAVNNTVLAGGLRDPILANTAIRDAKNEFRTYLGGTDKMSKEKFNEAKQYAAQIDGNYNMLFMIIAATTAAGIVLLITLLQLIPRSISKPVKELTEAATLMSKGDLNQQINPSQIKEFKTLSETLERMRMSQKTLIDRMLNKA